MYEISFVYKNTWYTLVGERASIYLLKQFLEEKKEIDEHLERVEKINKVGVR
jgi:ferritin-like metal-binding protein YciE